MELYIAGGCGEHGRNSFLFLTHSHNDHSGGIEWLIENGFHGCIISTDETRKQVNIAYENWVILPVTGRMPLRKEIGQTLSITYGRTGHCIGSIWFLIEWNYKKVFFSGDYKEDSSVYMCDRVRNIFADCAVIDCAYGNLKIDTVGFGDSLIKRVENTIHTGGSVYLPVPKYGRGLEIIQILNKSGDEYPVYADRNIYEQMELIKQRGCLWTKSMNISLQSLKTWNDEPAVLFISDPQLQKEEDYELAIKVYQNGGSILLTGHVYSGTGAEKLLKKKLIRAITIIGMSTLLFANTAYAKENMVPDYEMKFLLDSNKVLNNDHELNSKYRDFLDTGKNYDTIGVLYLETPDYSLMV